MPTYLVGYDLVRPGQTYEPLWEYLRSFGTYWHNLDSTWILKSDFTVVQLRDGISGYLDANDELFVVDITGKAAAWRGFSNEGSQWLQQQL